MEKDDDFTPWHPDMSRYNNILIQDGKPINDVHFVQNERAELASILGQNVIQQNNFEPPLEGISEDDAFKSFLPRGVQSTDELMTYYDYEISKND